VNLKELYEKSSTLPAFTFDRAPCTELYKDIRCSHTHLLWAHGYWLKPNKAQVTAGIILTQDLKGGIFDFYNDGAAEYDDGNVLMTGNWNIRTISSGYYDEYGNYYSDLHDSFEIHVYDSYTHSSADLYFDDVRFTGNKIIATNYYGGVISKYVFGRY
jgi:hypothetical protein